MSKLKSLPTLYYLLDKAVMTLQTFVLKTSNKYLISSKRNEQKKKTQKKPENPVQYSKTLKTEWENQCIKRNHSRATTIESSKILKISS